MRLQMIIGLINNLNLSQLIRLFIQLLLAIQLTFIFSSSYAQVNKKSSSDFNDANLLIVNLDRSMNSLDSNYQEFRKYLHKNGFKIKNSSRTFDHISIETNKKWVDVGGSMETPIKIKAKIYENMIKVAGYEEVDLFDYYRIESSNSSYKTTWNSLVRIISDFGYSITYAEN